MCKIRSEVTFRVIKNIYFNGNNLTQNLSAIPPRANERSTNYVTIGLLLTQTSSGKLSDWKTRNAILIDQSIKRLLQSRQGKKIWKNLPFKGKNWKKFTLTGEQCKEFTLKEWKLERNNPRRMKIAKNSPLKIKNCNEFILKG